ncbi:Equilibrative nucleoside transporter, partial [Dillenia turbinata]
MGISSLAVLIPDVTNEPHYKVSLLKSFDSGVSTIFCGNTCHTYHEAKINTRKHNLFGFIFFFISSVLVLALDLATSGKGGLGPFIGICAISCALGVADAHVQGGMTRVLSLMRPEFVQSFFAGLAASGFLTPSLRLVTKAAFENTQDGLRKGALLFFGISAFFELLCVLLYAYVFPKLPVMKYFRSKAALEGSKTVSAILLLTARNPKEYNWLSNKELLLQNFGYALELFLIYVVTLSIFPGFLSEDAGSHSVAMYNTWDLIGRYIPVIKAIKLVSRKGLTVAIFLRFFLIPAFYFTGKYGDQGWMILLTSFLSLSHDCSTKGLQ